MQTKHSTTQQKSTAAQATKYNHIQTNMFTEQSFEKLNWIYLSMCGKKAYMYASIRIYKCNRSHSAGFDITIDSKISMWSLIVVHLFLLNKSVSFAIENNI